MADKAAEAKAGAANGTAAAADSMETTQANNASTANSTTSSSKTRTVPQIGPIQQIPPHPSQTAQKKSSSSTSSHVISSIATPGCGANRPVKVQYCNQRVIGNGSFGVVYRAELCGTSLDYPDSDHEEEAVGNRFIEL